MIDQIVLREILFTIAEQKNLNLPYVVDERNSQTAAPDESREEIRQI